MAKEIKLSELRELVEAGKKLPELAEYFELNQAQVRKLLKEAGLQIRKFRTPAFVLVNDEETQGSLPEVPSENLTPETEEVNGSDSEIPNWA